MAVLFLLVAFQVFIIRVFRLFPVAVVRLIDDEDVIKSRSNETKRLRARWNDPRLFVVTRSPRRLNLALKMGIVRGPYVKCVWST
jgi:hypothetical protein